MRVHVYSPFDQTENERKVFFGGSDTEKQGKISHKST